MSTQFRTNSKKEHYPLRPSKGLNESDFREGSISVTGIGGPRRQYSRATPTSEIAHIKTQSNFLKSLNRRLAIATDKEARASSKTAKAEKKHEKLERTKEADKNLELANKFMERQERLRRGENPPPVDVVVNVESGPTLPKNISPEEKKKMETQKAQEGKKEESIIKNITEPEKVEQPPSPAMARHAQSVSDEPATPSPQTEEAYAYAASPAYTTGGKQPDKPKQKTQQQSDLSLNELALLRYPAKG